MNVIDTTLNHTQAEKSLNMTECNWKLPECTGMLSAAGRVYILKSPT